MKPKNKKNQLKQQDKKLRSPIFNIEELKVKFTHLKKFLKKIWLKFSNNNF